MDVLIRFVNTAAGLAVAGGSLMAGFAALLLAIDKIRKARKMVSSSVNKRTADRDNQRLYKVLGGLGVFLMLLGVGGVAARFAQPEVVQPVADLGSQAITFPVDLESYFVPSGWFGDGEQGTTYLKLESTSQDVNGVTQVAHKITYTPGPQRFAGIFWQSPPKNWGERPGRDLAGATRVKSIVR